MIKQQPKSKVNKSPINTHQCFLFILLLLFIGKTNAKPIEIPHFKDGTIGHHVQYFQESTQTLNLEQAKAFFKHNKTIQGKNDSISLGIGVSPAWLKFTVDNKMPQNQRYRLSIETPWLDQIDSWLIHKNNKIKHVIGGDSVAFEKRPMQYRFYAFEHNFPTGITEIYIRVESLGPMAIPIRLSSSKKAIVRDISSGYQYGVLYGIMSALALYNLILFVFVRQKEYGLYGLYLIGFVLNSLSYTGQIHAVFTPDYGPYFQDWVDIFLMITYSVAGLHFARHLLETKTYAPILDKVVINTTIIIPSAMFVGFILNQLVISISLAFILNCSFVILFIALGIYALKAKKPFAIIFLFSSVIAALCITVSTLAVAGVLIPYNDYTFKAIEVGMALEAILLAIILARQFRIAKLEKFIAEEHARSDTLTQLNNRHGFNQVSVPIWQNIIREKRDAALVIIDIDDFKSVNDLYGHHGGDQALIKIAQCIAQVGRKGDISARWGGEEFIIFLPETSQQQAMVQAERLREKISHTRVKVDDKLFALTASLGVAGSVDGKYSNKPLSELGLEFLINQADTALYHAKNSGKNSVCNSST